MKDARQELGRLILDGLMGRSLKQLFYQLRAAFNAAGQSVSVSAFDCWVGGLKFPATRLRQQIIAEVVGGPCGLAIRNLPAPAFRGYRRAAAKEEIMGKGPSHSSREHGRKAARIYEIVSVVGEDGQRRAVAQITCTRCGSTEVQQGRRGKMDDQQLFQARGWETGISASRDFCPSCVKARSKVVIKMEDHVKKTEVVEAAAAISREDGRILSRLIEDHWDEMNGRYLAGWSDTKLATDAGRPVEHVKAIRERDFGGVGEDPQLADFLSATIEVRGDLAGLQGHMEGLAASVSELASQHDKVQRLLEKYRDSHNALATKVKRLTEVADRLRPFDQKAVG